MYYIVMFDDPVMRIPIVQTLVFVGEMVRGGGSRFLCLNEIRAGGGKSLFSVEYDQVEEMLLDGPGLVSLLEKYVC